MAKLYLIIIILGILGGGGYAAKSYYEWSEATIATLRENNIKLKDAAETLQATVEKMAADQKKNEELNRDLTKRLQQSQEHLDKLRGAFAKIDLTMEALTDAQGLEDRVNRAVDRLIGWIADETNPNPIADDATDGVRDENAGTGSSSNN